MLISKTFTNLCIMSDPKLTEYLKTLDKHIQPVSRIYINQKVVISPRVNQPWGGQEGYVISIEITGINVCLPGLNGSIHEFPTVALYEQK